MWAQLNEETVMKASAHFWEQMLAMKLDRIAFPGQFCVGAGHVVGRVTLSGAWRGRIEVRMAGGLAYEATAAMMMQPRETVVEADALDATREIANMIAGAIKSSLPRPCAMTVPESATESGCFCGEARREGVLVVAFRHGTGDLMVRVWEQESAAQTADNAGMDLSVEPCINSCMDPCTDPCTA